MFVRVKRSDRVRPPPLPSRAISRPKPGTMVVVTKGFAAGLLGMSERALPWQRISSNRTYVRLCGPHDVIWCISNSRLRPATSQEAQRWGRDSFAAHVARMNGGCNAVEGQSGKGAHQEGRQV